MNKKAPIDIKFSKQVWLVAKEKAPKQMQYVFQAFADKKTINEITRLLTKASGKRWKAINQIV